ncbi:polyprotein [Jatobal virus]|uniref:Envelopment polyprotein n=1 Tax=Jatobal virus TaxID=150058 RepID=M1F0P5_9VIRU|nr:polyprotein [Jatobal virus]AFI24667.1 polyprotein [Jatobal virus]
MFFQIIEFFLCLVVVVSNPLTKDHTGNRCFAGGHLFKEITQKVGTSEICIKDDISIIKSQVEIIKKQNDISYNIKFYRIYLVKEWSDCNPILDVHGSVMILDITNSGLIEPKMYTCRASCDITLDKDNAEVIFISQKSNNYELAGTTVMHGWFKNVVSVKLEHTCEHLSATCGQKTIKFHACFRQHRGCARFFRNTYMPIAMVEALCSNIELIIFVSYIFICLAFSFIITRTYIAYLLIPVFYPITYIYGKLYLKCLKTCPNCLLAIHPFTNCKNICICGSRFSNTESLKVHRLGNCYGYKALSGARSMCKSKTSSFATAVFFGIIILSFITPLHGEKTYKLSELPDDYIKLEMMIKNINTKETITDILNYALIFSIIIITVCQDYFFNFLYKGRFRFCSFCEMIHARKGLKIFSNMTNKCGTCICGFNQEIRSGFDYEIFIKDMHIAKESCRYNYFKSYNVSMKILLILMLIPLIGTTVADDTVCLKYDLNKGLGDLKNCYGLKLGISNYKSVDSAYNELTEKKLVSDLDKLDLSILKGSKEHIFDAIENSLNIHRMVFLEYLAYKTNPKLKEITHNTGPYNVAWRAFIHNNNLEICGSYPYKLICYCINQKTHCENTTVDHGSQIQPYYTKHPNTYKADMEALLKTIQIAFRGIVKVLIQFYVENNKTSDLINLLTELQTKMENNPQMKGILKFLCEFMKTPLQVPKTMKINVKPDISGANPFNNFSTSKENITKCVKIVKLRCITKSTLIEHNYILCGESEKKIYQWPTKPTIMENGNACLGDKHCHLQFTPIENDEAIKTVSCYKENFEQNPGPMNTQLKKCEALNVGICVTIKNENWPIVQCKTELYYYADGRIHAKDGTINNYCFSEKCNVDRFPIHSDYISTCNWQETAKDYQHVKEFIHLDIESYKRAIESDIKTDLVIHKFRPTKNLPHVIPRYSSLILQGTETSDGIQNAFIQGSLPAISGLANGYHLYTPNSKQLFDVILFLRKASYRAEYRRIYTTGPTIGINVEHNEQCTGSCPKTIEKKQNWLTFSKEHTSQWGCEEYGCLAMDAGCVYGSCQDIIRPEIDIYKIYGSERSMVELCITLPHETFCNDLDVLEPIIGDKIQAAFQTVQSTHMPRLIAIKNNKAFTGQINDLGNTASYCGSVQKFNGTILGQGDPKFDYICHLLKRKDIIVRRCYNNNYESCKFLTPRPDIIIDKKNDILQASIVGMNLGQMNFKIMLGDINYNQYTETENLEITGQCVGCIDCSEDIICSLKISSQSESVCKITSECRLYIENILIQPSVNDYNIKLTCRSKSDKLKINICKQEFVLPLTIKSHNQKIDLSKLDESNYIKEEDLRCETMLCKVKDEGISFITEGIFGGISYFWKTIIISLATIGILVIFYYIGLPLFKILKDYLKRNELEYLAERKLK